MISLGSIDTHSLHAFATDRPRVSSPLPSRASSTISDARPSLRHGELPYKAGWISLQTKGGVRKRAVERHAVLAGPTITLAASPNTAIMGTSLQLHGAEVRKDKIPGTLRIHIVAKNVHAPEDAEAITVIAENRDDFNSWFRELTRAAERHINHDYEFESIIGATLFGTLARGRDILSSEPASIFITQKSKLPNELLTLARREAMILILCPILPSIPTIYDLYETPTSIYCVTEPLPTDSSIRDIVRGKTPLSERDTAGIMYSLLTTLAALLDAKIVHRGVNLDSVLLVDKTEAEKGVKLTSFQFALESLDSKIDSYSPLDAIKHFGIDAPVENSIAPFVAPEVARGTLDSVKQDSWAVGVLMHYCLAAATPFDGPDQTARRALKVIQSACGMPAFRGVMWDGISKDARDLCARLLHADPNERLSPQQALGHRWFRWNQPRPQ